MFSPLPTDVVIESPTRRHTDTFLHSRVMLSPLNKMASPPPSPLHRRQSSNFSANSPRSSRRLSNNLSSSSRRSSAFLDRRDSMAGTGDSLASELGGMENFGESLADELDGWSGEEGLEEEEEEEEDETDYSLVNIDAGAGQGPQERDSGVDVASSPPGRKHLHPDSARTGHQRSGSAYDGSEYGSESDLEATELVSASLEARMAAIEAMARRGLEENGSDGDRVVSRLTEKLQDLGNQGDFEMGAARLSTAYTALSTHLTNQARVISQLTSTFMLPFTAVFLPTDFLDELLPHIDDTLKSMPTLLPSARPHHSVHTLLLETSDLIQDLNYLKDTLQVNQQSTNSGSRKLRVVKDLLRETREEMDSRDESVRWIEQGCWDQRLSQRDVEKECAGILDGFEKVCEGWGERFKQQIAAA